MTMLLLPCLRTLGELATEWDWTEEELIELGWTDELCRQVAVVTTRMKTATEGENDTIVEIHL